MLEDNMENYILKNINQDNIEYLVFGTSVESPLFCITEIAKNIRDNKDVKVLFDQLLQTGNSENRFLMLELKNGTFELSSATCINPQIISDEIKIHITEFLRQNPKILKYSILLNDQKKIIEQGGII